MNAAWCAVFVSFIANKDDVPTSVIPKFCNCDDGVKWFKKKDQYKLSKAYKGSYVPKTDDIVFFSSDHTQTDSTHVGIVVAVTGNVLHTIEGNSRDAVRQRTYTLDDPYIIGYGVPAYPSRKPGALPEVVALRSMDGANTVTLRRGDKSELVRAVQKVLIAQGYTCGVHGANGSFGPDTEAAVKRYQRTVVGLKKPDGVIEAGNRTWKSLLSS
jgi:hypothetical protein